MKSNWKSAGAGAVLIVLLTGIAYLPTRNAGFVFDDEQNVTANQSLRSLEGLKRIWTDPQASYQYYPLTYTSFWVEYHLWGLRPAGYHVGNVVWHTLNALLVWWLLARLAVPGAWLAALLFALHPVHVESVAWISERKNVLSGFFYLGSLLTYLRFTVGPKRLWRFYALSLALFLCALLSKTSAVSMPFVVLLILWWKQERIKGQDLLALIPFLLAGAALGLVTARVEVQGAQGPEWQLSLLERCLIAGRVVWFYAGKLIWPHPLMMVYPRWQVSTTVWWQYLFPGAAGAVVLVLCRYRQRLGKAPLVAVLFFAGSLVPIPALINIAFMRYSYVADHWQYLPSIGLITLAAACIGNLVQEKTVRTTVTVMAAVVLGALSWRHCAVFADAETLWQDTVAKNPGCWMPHYNLGLVLLQAGRVPEAIRQCEQALQLKPDHPESHNNLGNALQQVGKVPEAIGQYELALRFKPDFAEARNNWGKALFHLGYDPEAIGQYELALRLKPDFAEAHNNLGIALFRLGRVPEAIGQFEQALRIKPDYAEAHNNWGNVLRQAGNVPEAIGQYELALRLKPDLVEAYNNLAWLLATLLPAEGGDPVRAVGLAQRACELTGNRVAVSVDALAAAYAATGRFNEAVATAQQAIELARSNGQTQLIGQIEARLELYRAGHAYR